MVTIRPTTDADLPAVRDMMREYVAWIGLDLSFQGFEEELRDLPGDYAPPRGALLVAEVEADIVAMIALRPFEGRIAEMKRLFVRPSARGLGLGLKLIDRLLSEARAMGYREIRLDTLPMMGGAQKMYESLGFRDIEPYYDTPVSGTRFMSLAL